MSNFKSGEILKSMNLIRRLNDSDLKELEIDGKRLEEENLKRWEYHFAVHYKNKKSDRWIDILKDMEAK